MRRSLPSFASERSRQLEERERLVREAEAATAREAEAQAAREKERQAREAAQLSAAEAARGEAELAKREAAQAQKVYFRWARRRAAAGFGGWSCWRLRLEAK
jgi:hypothetical protein